MNNLSVPSNYQSAPTAQMGGRGYHHKKGCKCPLCMKGGRGYHHKKGCICPLCMKGGRGYHHKKGCKCPLCKKRGGGYEDDTDIETGFTKSSQGNDDEFNYANDADYDDLEKAEMGMAGPSVKVGGSRKRKSKSNKARKSRKNRKTRRHTRKSMSKKRRNH